MKNFYCKCRLHLWLACLTAGIGLSACSDGDEGGGIRDTSPTNPSNSNLLIPIPSIAEQQRIVAILDRFDTLTTDLTQGLPAEIEKRRQQYEYYRDKLLTFRRKGA